MKHIKQTKRFNRRPIIVALVVIALLVAAVAAFAYKRHIDSNPTTYNKKPKIDYSPATPAEKADSEQHKEDSTQKEDTPTPTPTPTGKTSVTPVIVDASQYDNQIEVRAYTSGIFEDGGTCTITFTQGSLKVTKQVTASKDATTTRCTNLDVARSEFQQPGQWTAIVSYSSSTAQGSSQPRTFEVK